MTVLHAFLVFWNWFMTTHSCEVFVPDSAGLGNHVVYGGNCIDALTYGHAVHGLVDWSGASQGGISFVGH